MWRLCQPDTRYDVVVSSRAYDLAVVGGGIVGLATAREVLARCRASVVLLEAEDQVAAHQTGHNSGVIHSGLYYRPGSLKARNCTAGRELLYAFCAERGIPHERCGKIVVATSEDQLERLTALEATGRANGLQGLAWLDAAALRRTEPHVSGVAGLHVPETGIVDFRLVARALAGEVERLGGAIRTGAGVEGIRRGASGFLLETPSGEIESRYLVNCAGLQADRVARLCGLRPALRIVPFLGEYVELGERARRLVRNLIYPVPDPRFPFLGVHFTRRIDGRVEAGPNALLAFSRSGYSRWSFSARDTWSSLTYRGFYRMGLRYFRAALAEQRRSLDRRAFLRSLRQLIPELEAEDLEPSTPGIRAQAVAPDGKLLDDFAIEEGEGMLHVLNAPSPAATASLSIGGFLAGKAEASFGLRARRQSPAHRASTGLPPTPGHAG